MIKLILPFYDITITLVHFAIVKIELTRKIIQAKFNQAEGDHLTLLAVYNSWKQNKLLQFHARLGHSLIPTENQINEIKICMHLHIPLRILFFTHLHF